MPANKDLKRIVRSRMQKTGESYATARLRVVGQNPPSPARFAELAGMSDDAVRAKTGHTWKEWVDSLDAVDAPRMTHRDIAKHVHDSYDVSGWWAQTVTVGYERIRGLRDIGQKRSGTYVANKSKTFAVPISRLYKAFSVKRTRARWLQDVELTIRTSTVDKSMRMSWPDGTSVQAYFTAKGPQKSQVAIQHADLPRKSEVTRRKDYWADRLNALADLL